MSKVTLSSKQRQELKIKLAAMRVKMNGHRRQERRDKAVGTELASCALKKIRASKKKGVPTSRMANVLSAMLSRIDKAERESDCFNLLLEWTFERFWGAKIAEYVTDFREVYDCLKWLDCTAKNPLVWGDIDCGAWVEPSDNLVIILTVYCAMRDDNTYLYMLEESIFGYKFHARTVWPRMKRVLPGAGWDYIEHASLRNYRQQKFHLDYGDCRDTGYCFTIDNQFEVPQADNAYYCAADVKWALWNLYGIYCAVDEAMKTACRLEGERRD